MKRVAIGFLGICICASVSGCSGNYDKAEEATKQMIAAMNDIAAALESVKDKETAKAAAPKIEAAVDKMQEAKKKADGLKGTQADKERLEKEYMPKIQEATARLQKAAMPAGLKCEGEPTFMKALEKMQSLK